MSPDNQKLSYILSPCGTSLLTNAAGKNRKLIFKYANFKNENDIPDNDKAQLRKVIELVKKQLFAANNQEAEKMSAEVNGILKIYSAGLTQRRDYHFLLCTDTFLGETTGKLVSEWLTSKNKNLQVEVHRHTDLQTNDIDSFQLALSELVKKLSREVPDFRKSGYRVIFNLTGGFKSVQGFLQSIASFYADESVYIFETSDNLLRIPRLPLRMDAVYSVENNMQAFRRLSLGLPVSDISNIPETLLFGLDDQISLSPWGELVWEQTRSSLYQKKLFPSPSKKIIYSRNFKKSVDKLPDDRKVLINVRIDQLAKHLESKGYNPSSLDFKQLKGNPLPPATHEFDAWSDKSAQRVFGYFEADTFILNSLDTGLH